MKKEEEPNVRVFFTKEGYIYENTKHERCGPYSIQERSLGDYEVKVAQELDVEPKDVLTAHLTLQKKPITIDEVISILSSTIKHDNPAKAILFFSMLSTYTEEDQQNIALQAESASGKSYIPLELVSYFPDEDKNIIASASPTAFFHENGILVDEFGQPINFAEKPPKNAPPEAVSEWNKRLRTSRILVNLERKILIFLDQPHYMLMEKLRPLLSHDKKELTYKITDKTQKYGLRTKNVIIKGYPTIIFCSTKLKLDEQEKTRIFLLSPEVGEEKLLESICLLGEKLGNRDQFRKTIEDDERRLWLKNRVHTIKEAGIRDVIIEKPKAICERFFNNHKHLIPRHQRDFPRLISLIKSHALLNFHHRESTTDKRIKANSKDIEAGFKIYNWIAKPNELGLSPQVFELYQKVIKPKLDPTIGLDRRSIINEHYKIYHRALSDEKLRREILPSLEAAGLIIQDTDPNDKRKKLVYPPDQSSISPKEYAKNDENNRGSIWGVKEETVIPLNPQSPNISEIIKTLQKTLPEKFMENDFVEISVKLELAEKNAKSLFQKFVEEGRILRDPNGFWRWIH